MRRQDVLTTSQTVLALLAVALSLTGAAVGAYRGWHQGGMVVAIFGSIGGLLFGGLVALIASAMWVGRAAIGRGIVSLFLAACVLLFIYLMGGHPTP